MTAIDLIFNNIVEFFPKNATEKAGWMMVLETATSKADGALLMLGKLGRRRKTVRNAAGLIYFIGMLVTLT